jgi:RNA polymerase sigma factor (sigma-70 family)
MKQALTGVPGKPDVGLLGWELMTAEQDQQIAETVERERSRLRNFIRRRVPDREDAEDILQDVFSELVEAYRLMKPIEQAGAWLFRVARNRIIDRFRKRREEPMREQLAEDGEVLMLEDVLPSPDAGPDAAYARSVLLEELEDALEELPQEQREVFVAHEIEGRSFKELAAESGVSVNTLLSRKHYAVLHLRERMRAIYNEFTEG